MLKRPLAFALIAIAAIMWRSPHVAARPSCQTQSPWVRTESRRFEIHYQRALGSELGRVVRIAEIAYTQVSRRLNFVLATKVPLIIFAPSGPMTANQVVEYATGDRVAPPQPHRSRIVLPLSDDNAQLETRLVHELTHLMAFEIVLPHRAGDGGIPRWVSEGLANHMVGIWSDDDTRVMRELVASAEIPALSELTERGEFATAHLNDAIGHAAFDYIESRWGATGIRRFLNALIVPRVDKIYDAVLELTPAEFDTVFRQYAERQFKPGASLDVGDTRRSAKEQNVTATMSSKRMADGKEWTTANLNINTSPSYCYSDSELNCRRYGRLYTWASASRACKTLGGGWRLPTDDEWRQLAKRYGGASDDSLDKGRAAFTTLVSGGPSGFNAVFGGNRSDGQYARLEAHGFYWTASDNDSKSAPFYNFGKGGQALHRQPTGDKQMAISVRCVRE